MQAVDALTVSVVVDNSSDMLSTRPAHMRRNCGFSSLPGCRN